MTRSRNAHRLASFWHAGTPTRVVKEMTPEPEATTVVDERLRYGYTLDDIDRLTRVACQAAHTMASDTQDRYAEAWGAIVERLYAADRGAPTEYDLIALGKAAIRDWVRGVHRTHNMPLDGGDAHTTYGAMCYWWDLARPTPSPESRVVDAHALREIWPRLDRKGQEALETIAAFDGDYREAARALGVSFRVLSNRVDLAVRQYLRLWHEGETASTVWHQPRRRVELETLVPCGTPSAYHRHRRRGEPTDEACREALRRARTERLARKAGAAQ